MQANYSSRNGHVLSYQQQTMTSTAAQAYLVECLCGRQPSISMNGQSIDIYYPIDDCPSRVAEPQDKTNKLNYTQSTDSCVDAFEFYKDDEPVANAPITSNGPCCILSTSNESTCIVSTPITSNKSVPTVLRHGSLAGPLPDSSSSLEDKDLIDIWTMLKV